MFRDKLKFLKPKEEEGNDRKKIENLVVFIVILIITIIAINIIWKDDGGKEKANDKEKDNTKQLASEVIEVSTSTDLEEKLKNILETMQGVGKVNVFINYSESSETVAMFNENSKSSTTEETHWLNEEEAFSLIENLLEQCEALIQENGDLKNEVELKQEQIEELAMKGE